MFRILLVLTFLVLGQATASESFSWGPYTVTVEDFVDEDGLEMQRLLLQKDGEETVLAEDYLVSVELAEVTGEGLPELIVNAYSGGAHCCNTVSIFSLQDGEVITLSSGDWGSGGLALVRDSDGDGKVELTLVKIYEYIDGLCFACSPVVWRTYVWNDGLFVDVTNRYPGPTQKMAQDALAALVKALDLESASGSELTGYAATYWTNSYALGRGEAAWAWLAEHLPPEVMGWLKKNRVELLRPFSALP